MEAVFIFLVSTLVPLITNLVVVLLVLFLSGVALYLFNISWLNPQILRWKLQKQGIKGPQPCFLYGNVPEMHKIQAQASINSSTHDHDDDDQFVAHDYTSTLFPYLEQWRKQYGCIYTYSTGMKQHLYVNDGEMVKEMNMSKSLSLGKPSYITKRLAPMLGNGILRSNGPIWSIHRKILSPVFFMDKVKDMVGLMLQSTEPLISKWEERINAGEGRMAEIMNVEEDLRCVSADVIARACFGTFSSYKGKQIFSKLRSLQKLISSQSVLFGAPTLGILATRKQKEMENLEKEIDDLIWETVEERKEECLNDDDDQKDLLHLILEGAINEVGNIKDYSSSKKFIVDNCKNIYFAGHESTATAASWCLMLLALHPEWQRRIRQEVAQLCPNGVIDSHSLSKMKMVTMVIQEVLRLYPPAAFISREALKDTKIGNINVPKGVCVWTLIPTLHRDAEIWGADVSEFKPERFANGVSKACKLPQVYIPFGLGPRLCLGRHFALVQLKVVISLIVSNFTFSLSPNYKHSPAYKMIVEPGQGVHILIQRSTKCT